MAFGHAAAAVVVGPGPGIARLLGQRSLTVDFVDHYRAASEQFDYVWEDRWIRDEGYLNLTTRLIDDLLAGAGIRPDELTHFCLPVSLRNVDRAVAAKCGIPETAVRDQLADGCGNSGAAHPLLMLVDALADARAGDRILIIGFAQGGDALLFEVTEEIDRFRASGGGVRKWLERSSPCSYPRYLVLSGLLQVARGMRAEVDKGTGLSAAYRHRDFLLNLVGGRCAACGTYQIPRTTICVNPDCGVADQQSAYSFAESLGRVASWSADHLTAIPDPPAYYGMVDFAEGGRLLMDFVEAGGGVDIGTEMRMVFRVKDYDPVRKYRRYFWKATPIRRRETDVG
jgi:uncharacterized OB-fold protein